MKRATIVVLVAIVQPISAFAQSDLGTLSGTPRQNYKDLLKLDEKRAEDLQSVVDATATAERLTILRDVGGKTTGRALACSSPDYYQHWLEARSGLASFYPTQSECW